MKFEFNGKGYLIEFRREYRTLPQHFQDPRRSDDEPPRKNDHPYTTVNIFEVDPADPLNKRPFRTATVGCYHKDRYSPEKGRCRALRLACVTIPKAMKPVLWKAYHGRPRPKSEPKAPVAPADRQKDGATPATVGSPVEA